MVALNWSLVDFPDDDDFWDDDIRFLLRKKGFHEIKFRACLADSVCFFIGQNEIRKLVLSKMVKQYAWSMPGYIGYSSSCSAVKLSGRRQPICILWWSIGRILTILSLYSCIEYRELDCVLKKIAFSRSERFITTKKSTSMRRRKTIIIRTDLIRNKRKHLPALDLILGDTGLWGVWTRQWFHPRRRLPLPRVVSFNIPEIASWSSNRDERQCRRKFDFDGFYTDR